MQLSRNVPIIYNLAKGDLHMKDNQLDRNSMDYIPTWDEMKLPSRLRQKLEQDIEDEAEMERVNKELDAHIEAWQRKHREKIRKNEIAKKEKLTRKNLAHWYSTLPRIEVEQMINDSRKLADQVLDHIRESATASWQLNYVEKLRLRVKRQPLTVELASPDKLRRFPMYDESTKKLYGSPYSFYRMWAHCFKSERKRVHHVTT